MKWRILCYHAVEPEHADAFASQLERFRAAGWKFGSLTECLENQGAKGKWLTVSFDDGDRTVCEVAQPILDRLGIRAILYVSTDYVVKGKLYRSERCRPAVNWGQLAQWLKAGHQIGGHTHSHLDLRNCSFEQCQEELSKSREMIEREWGITPVDFAYPWGRYGERALQILRRECWRSAVTIDRGCNQPGCDPLRLKRDVIAPWWTERRIRFLFSLGWTGGLYRFQKKLRDR